MSTSIDNYKNLEYVQKVLSENLENVQISSLRIIENVLYSLIEEKEVSRKMKRKIYDQLLEWKRNDSRDCALLIDGARRVGKSYIVEEFGKNEYKSYIIIDFNRAKKETKELFLSYLNDLDTFFLLLSTIYRTRLYQHESLIVFDEVQLFPEARAAIKYLVQDSRYDYIETGSLISIRKNVKNIQIPSEERHIKMNPMDFEEFCWALGDYQTVPCIRKFFEIRKPLGPLFRTINTLFREYIIVGGMPQAVKAFAETKNFSKVDRIKRDILTLYRNDIAKYGEDIAETTAIFDEIPSQLQKYERKFVLSDIKSGARMRSYRDAFFWLADSGVMTPCYNTTEPSLGLKMNMNRTTMKCFMADTGLLLSHTFNENSIVSEEVYNKIMLDKLAVNFGNLMENVVAQILTANGHSLYFYSNPDRTDSSSRMEIDFLIAKNTITNKHNILPIEIKTGKNYTLSSLRKFRDKFRDQIGVPYVFHEGEYKEEDGIVFLPLFMVICL